LLECIDMIEKITGVEPKVEYGPDRFGDLRYFVCDISKAREKLGWEPKILPKEGIIKLCEWIKENINVFKDKE